MNEMLIICDYYYYFFFKLYDSPVVKFTRNNNWTLHNGCYNSNIGYIFKFCWYDNFVCSVFIFLGHLPLQNWGTSSWSFRLLLLSFCQFYVNIDTMLIFRSIRHSKLLLHIENGLLEWWMNGWMDGSVLRYVYTRDHFKDIADCWMRCRRRQSSGDGKMHYLYIMLFFLLPVFL